MSVLVGRAAPTAVDLDVLVGGVGAPAYVSSDDVESVGAIVQRAIGVHLGAGALLGGGHWAELRVSPGTVGVHYRHVYGMDLADSFETEDQLDPGLGWMSQRRREQGLLWADEVEAPKRGAITEWSAGSRRRMYQAIAQLDVADWADDDGAFALGTLTLPGMWEHLAPTGQEWKRLVRQFFRRWDREVGGERDRRGLWKLEFQDRGAPHEHMLLRVPAFAHPRTCERCALDRAWDARLEVLRGRLQRVTTRLGTTRTALLEVARLTARRRGSLRCAEQLLNASRERAVARLSGHLRARPTLPHERMTTEEWWAWAWSQVVGADDRSCHRCHTDDLGYEWSAGYGVDELGYPGQLGYAPFGVCTCEVPDTERRRHRAAHGRRSRSLDFSGRFDDPRRMSVYFGKHGAKSLDDKEYQHIVPPLWQQEGRGPGRFWGVWGLDRSVATVTVERRTAHRLERILRGVARGRAAATALGRLRARTDLSDVEYRQQLRELRVRRGRSLRGRGGWVLVNDGCLLALRLRQAIADP